MTFDEMVAQVLPIFPDALFHDGDEGEIVILTGSVLRNNKLEPIN
jgi:hypothetical protein